MKEARYYTKEEGTILCGLCGKEAMSDTGEKPLKESQTLLCHLCPHHCRIPEGSRGICQARRNKDGKLIADSYGFISSIALDPIEKKPLRNFFPGSKILSIGSYGCNFHCGFCQNYTISMETPECEYYTPEELAKLSQEQKEQGNIGIAYTYNEPFIGYEFVTDCAKSIHTQGQKNILVTNGYVEEAPLKELLPYIDAMNIDLKSFNPNFYQNIGGDLETVKRTIQIAAKSCHIEITTLIINGENDTPEEIEALAKWLANINQEIPLHLSRFFPTYKYRNHHPTTTESIHQLSALAKQHLTKVYEGNMP
jgi:pyruvate formate lyase activating enzyme